MLQPDKLVDDRLRTVDPNKNDLALAESQSVTNANLNSIDETASILSPKQEIDTNAKTEKSVPFSEESPPVAQSQEVSSSTPKSTKSPPPLKRVSSSCRWINITRDKVISSPEKECHGTGGNGQNKSLNSSFRHSSSTLLEDINQVCTTRIATFVALRHGCCELNIRC